MPRTARFPYIRTAVAAEVAKQLTLWELEKHVLREAVLAGFEPTDEQVLRRVDKYLKAQQIAGVGLDSVDELEPSGPREVFGDL